MRSKAAILFSSILLFALFAAVASVSLPPVMEAVGGSGSDMELAGDTLVVGVTVGFVVSLLWGIARVAP